MIFIYKDARSYEHKIILNSLFSLDYVTNAQTLLVYFKLTLPWSPLAQCTFSHTIPLRKDKMAFWLVFQLSTEEVSRNETPRLWWGRGKGNWWKRENAREIDENSAAIRAPTQFTDSDSAGEPRSCELHITECGVWYPALTSRRHAPFLYIDMILQWAHNPWRWGQVRPCRNWHSEFTKYIQEFY